MRLALYNHLLAFLPLAFGFGATFFTMAGGVGFTLPGLLAFFSLGFRV